MRLLITSCCLAVALAAGGCGARERPTPVEPPSAGPTQVPTQAPSATEPAAEQGTQSAPRRPFYHQAHPYRLQNSVRGLHAARAAGREWIDIDSNYCWDDDRTALVPLAVHWRHLRGDHFRDPSGRVPQDARWSDLTLSTARRLRTDDPNPYRVLTMAEMVRAAGRAGLTGIEWEVKNGVGFERAATYRHVLAVAADAGVEVIVKTLRDVGGERAALRRLAAAKSAGATTMLLNHDREPVAISAHRSSYVDYVRGRWTDVG